MRIKKKHRHNKGFWGWKCQSYFYYLLGICTPTSEMQQALAGEDCRKTTQGMFFITTNAASPYALGRIADSNKILKTNQQQLQIPLNSITQVDPFQRGIDAFGKLDGNFNNLAYPANDEQIDTYFINSGSNQNTHSFLNRFRLQNEEKQSAVKWRPNSRQSRNDNAHIRSNEIIN